MTRFSLSDGPDHARQLIDAYLLDDLDEVGARQLAQHVRGCPGCAAELGGSTRLLELLRTLPEPAATAGLDERIIAATIADRALRVGRPPLVAGLARQIFRGAMRTTGTVVVTIVSVALIGGAFVFAASQFILPPLPRDTARAMLPIVATPTVPPTESTRSAVPNGTPTGEPRTPAPAVVPVTPTHAPTPFITPVPSATPETSASPVVTPEPSAVPSPTPPSTANPTPTATATPSPTATPSASVIPTPTATPQGTPKPHITPPPSDSPSPDPTVTPASGATSLPSP